MDTPDIVKLLTDFVLATVFLVLYVRSQQELVKTVKEIAEQRRLENAEMRNLLFALAKRGIDTRGAEFDSSTQIPIMTQNKAP